MKSRLKKEIEHARPKLRKVTPLSHWIVFTMGLFNIILGLSFVFAVDDDKFTASLLILNDLFTYDVWGIMFIVLGLVKLYSLYANNWTLARNSLLAGVGLKSAWAIALTIRTITSPGTFFLNLIWVTLAVIQIGCYIFFSPKIPSATKGGSDAE